MGSEDILLINFHRLVLCYFSNKRVGLSPVTVHAITKNCGGGGGGRHFIPNLPIPMTAPECHPI